MGVQREIQAGLGVAGSHGYLARAAMAAGNPLRAVVLGGRAWLQLRGLDDVFGQVLVLQDLSRPLAAVAGEEPATVALRLAWCLAATINDPLAQQLEQTTGQSPPPPEAAGELQARVQAVVDACEADLQARGEDPYSPLE